MAYSGYRYLFLLLLVLINSSLFSQTAEWIGIGKDTSTPYGTGSSFRINDVLVDQGNGDIYVAAIIRYTVGYGNRSFTSTNGSSDVLVMKLDLNNQILWTKQLTSEGNEGNPVLSFYRGGILLSFQIDGNYFAEGEEYADDAGKLMLTRVDKTDGSLSMPKQLGIIGAGSARATITNDVYLTAFYRGASVFEGIALPDHFVRDPWGEMHRTHEFILARFNQDLDLLWHKTSSHGSCCTDPYLQGVEYDQRSQRIAAWGYYGNSFSFNNTSYASDDEAFLMIMDEQGNKIWDLTFNPNESFARVTLKSVLIDAHGNLFVSGHYSKSIRIGDLILPPNPSSNLRTGFLAKISSDGTPIWAIPVMGTNDASVNAIMQKDEDIYFGGHFAGELTVDGQRLYIKDPASTVLTGFIGKIDSEPGQISAFMISEGPSMSMINELQRMPGRFFGVSGRFTERMALGCLEVTGGYQTHFVSRINISGEIDRPVIMANKTICEGVPLEITIQNYDPNYSYDISLDEGMHLIDKSDGIFTIGMTAVVNPDSSRIFITAANSCDWYAVSQPVYAKRKLNPVLSGEIIAPEELCTGQEYVLSVSQPASHQNTYRWSIPEDLEPVNGSLVTLEPNLEVYVREGFNTGMIKVIAENECADSPALEKSVRALSPLGELTVSGDNLICDTDQILTFTVEVQQTEEDEITFEYFLSSGLMFLNGQKGTITTNANTVQIKVDPGAVRRETVLLVKAMNNCFETAATSIPIVISREAERPQLFYDECQTYIESSLSESIVWKVDGVIRQDIQGALIREPDNGEYQVGYSTLCETTWSEPVVIDAPRVEKAFIPNVFTPNQDAWNDTFELGTSLIGSDLKIYNRWGDLVYSLPNYQNNWRGENLSPGVYYYVIENNCLEKRLKGSVTILR